MAVYKPDKWVIIKICSFSEKCYYRVLGSWAGGYTSGDAWKLSSGITRVTKHQNYYHFENVSGSTYICHENMYGITVYTGQILTYMVEQNTEADVERMPEDTNWLEVDY